MQVLIRKPAWFRWGLSNACHHADGMLDAAAESHWESSKIQLRDRDRGPVGGGVQLLEPCSQAPKHDDEGATRRGHRPQLAVRTIVPVPQSCSNTPNRSSAVRRLAPMELVISKPLFRWRFCSVLRQTMGTDRRVLRCGLIRSQDLIQSLSICSMMFSMQLSRMTCL